MSVRLTDTGHAHRISALLSLVIGMAVSMAAGMGCATTTAVKERVTGIAHSARYKSHSNGQKASLENFKDGVRDGKQQYFNLDGELYREEEFFYGQARGTHIYYPEKDPFKGPARTRKRIRVGLGVYSAPLGSLLSAEISQNLTPRIEWSVSGGTARGGLKSLGATWSSVWGAAFRTSFPDQKLSPLLGLGYSFLMGHAEDKSFQMQGILSLDFGLDYQHRRGTFTIGTMLGVTPLVEPYPYARWSWTIP